MIIPIDDDWRIRSDRDNWMLEERHESKKSDAKRKEYWTVEGYYGSIEQAALACYELRLRLSNVEGVVEAKKEASRLCQALTDCLMAIRDIDGNRESIKESAN